MQALVCFWSAIIWLALLFALAIPDVWLGHYRGRTLKLIPRLQNLTLDSAFSAPALARKSRL
ncbi:hypothetical protein H8F23_00660 [Pseudomonas sp. P155]|uniref:Uncharacterized protein n=1 Tax=Pseudomonas neuropathica TaxID=2730425 RepID=A0ABS0BE27_9PSED|nr:hypothetical protein [Pseudomonas neuropathica]MBF6031753.1 hypothetical protein [Pseudomonas neuropathica]